MPPPKTKKRKPSGNTQKNSVKTFFVGPNTQLQGSNKNNIFALISFIEDNIDVDTIKKIIEISITEALTSMERQQDVNSLNNVKNTPTLILLKFSESIDVEKQIFLLEKKKRQLHL